MKHPSLRLVLALAVAGMLAGCVTVEPSRSPAVARRSSVEIWDRLYFGRNIPKGGEVSDADWATFLTEVVTPRFPNGFTVLRGEGQWLGQAGAIVHEQSFILEVAHPDTEAAARSVAEIAAEFKRRFAQEAVLRLRGRVDASF